MTSLDEEIQAIEKEGFFKRAFKKKGKHIPNMLLSGGLATAARYFYAKNAGDSGMGDAAIASTATLVDVFVFWGSYIPQMAYKDRNYMKEKGKYVWSKIAQKAVDYTGLIGMSEVVYMTLSIAAQYAMQKSGIAPENASLAIQGTAIAVFTGLMPILQYSSEVGSEYLFNAFKRNKPTGVD